MRGFTPADWQFQEDYMSTPTVTPNLPTKPAPPSKGLISDGIKTILIFVLLIAVGYLLFDNYKSKERYRLQFTEFADRILDLDNNSKTERAMLSNEISDLRGDVAGTQRAVGSTKEELQKTTAQIKAESKKTKAELSEVLQTKADTAQVQAIKTDADSKIGQVSTEVGGVKTEVVAVKKELETTKRDLEGTQRRLSDVRETLGAAVAKNATELAELRLKGERNYIEFEIHRKNQLTKVEDIRLILTKTDHKKGKYNIKIVVDDNQLEKKDRLINEPVQFLVGRNRIRYELVVNWIEKDRIGGYLSIPKDKSLSAENVMP